MKRVYSSLVLAGALALATTTTGHADPSPEYELHEWGTFTSVFGSDGTLLNGLDAEEETLPPFVHAHEGMSPIAGFPFVKGFRRPLHHVTLKMETPVIYFYSDTPFTAHVEVGFKNGSISQWFPQRSGGETPPAFTRLDNGALVGGDIDFAEPYQGSIAWDVDVLERSPENDGKVFQGSETLTWVHPRMTDANVVRTAEGEHEKYLFYRGVGNFDSALQPQFSSDAMLRLTNSGRETIPYLLIFEHRDDGNVRFSVREKLEPGGTETFQTNEMAPANTRWERPVYDRLVEGLVAQGLFQREADAMARTWWQSYFARPGLRVFWIVPASAVEERLPLEVTPQPANIVRVLVGRAEVLSPEFERGLVKAHHAKKMDPYHNYFYKAYMERLDQLLAAGKEAPKVTFLNLFNFLSR